MVGSALVRALSGSGHTLLLPSRQEVDLTRQKEVEDWMEQARPQWVFLAAAKVGGIAANRDFPAQFAYENLAIATHVMHSAYRYGVEKLLFLGSSCIYPRMTPQPIAETALLSGLLEPTNQAYAIAKIAGIELCRSYRRQYACDFIAAMPTNLYGPGDCYDLSTSHVVPALIRKIHEAKLQNAPRVSIWGSGQALREFLHVDDLARACLLLMQRYSSEDPINIGTGKDLSIEQLAHLLADIIGFPKDRFYFDPSFPDGTPRKCLDISKITQLGWEAEIGLEEGLRRTYQELRGAGAP